MGERDVGMDPLEAVPLEVQRAKDWRAGRHRVDGGAGIVNETGQRKLGGAGGAAGSFHGLENEYAQAGPCQEDGGGEAVGAGADDDGIMGAGRMPLRIHGGHCRGKHPSCKERLLQCQRAKSSGDATDGEDRGRYPYTLVKKRLVIHGFGNYFH